MGLDKSDPAVYATLPAFGLGDFAPFQWERSTHITRVRIFWHLILAWLLALALCGWLLVSTAVYFFVRHQRGYTTVRYHHVLLYPWQKDDYRHAKYSFLMNRGKAAYSAGEYLDAFQDMRLSLRVIPEDTEARRKVAALYSAVKRHDLAELMWLDGLNYHAGNRRYVTEVCAYLFSRQRDDQVVAETRRLLAADPQDINLRHVLIMAQATAHFHRGRHAAAEAVLRDYKKSRTRDDSVLRARIAAARSQDERALAMFSELARRLPRDPEIYKLHIALLRRLGRDEAIRSLCVLRQLEQPDQPQPFLDVLPALDPDRDAPRWAASIEEIFTRFPKHPGAMKDLAALAAAKGQPALARRVYLHCRKGKLPWSHAAAAWLGAHITRQDYAETLLTAKTILLENPDWEPVHGVELNALRAVASFALGDRALAALQLQSYLTQVPAGTHDLPALADCFVRIGAGDLALATLSSALADDEFNQPTLTHWIELSAKHVITEEVLVRAERLLAMRQPSAPALAALRDALQSDAYLLLPGRTPVLNELTTALSPHRVAEGK